MIPVLKEIITNFQTETNFKFIKEIAEGGYGIVLQVQDQTTGLIKAAKLVPYATIGEEYFWHRLNHPNIIILNEIVSLSSCGSAYIMPFYEYDLFNAIFVSDFYTSPYSFARKKQYLSQILCGLDYLHSSQLCHFDLKTENVMISINSDTAVIGDFSTLKKINKHNNYFFAINPIYHPPEYVARQRNGKLNPYLAEMWTFGILTVQVFTIHSLDRHFHDSEKTDTDVHQFLECLRRKINIEIVLQKSHPMNYLSAVDVKGFTSFLDQFLSMTPKNRVSAAVAMSHVFLSSALYRSRMGSSDSDEEGILYMKMGQSRKAYSDYYTQMTPEKARRCRDLSGFQCSKVNDDSSQLGQPSGSEVPSLYFDEFDESFHRNSMSSNVSNFPKLDYCSDCDQWWVVEVNHECNKDLKSAKNSAEDIQREPKKTCFSWIFGLFKRVRRNRPANQTTNIRSGRLRRIKRQFNIVADNDSISADVTVESLVSMNGEVIRSNQMVACNLTQPSPNLDDTSNLKVNLIACNESNESFLDVCKLDNNALSHSANSTESLTCENFNIGDSRRRVCKSLTGSCYIRCKCYCYERPKTLLSERKFKDCVKYASDPGFSTTTNDMRTHHVARGQMDHRNAQIVTKFEGNIEKQNINQLFNNDVVKNWKSPGKIQNDENFGYFTKFS